MMMKMKGVLLMLAILVTLLYSETSARPVSKLKTTNNKQTHRTLAHKQYFVDECTIEEYLNATPYISTECKEELRSVETAFYFDFEEGIRTACGTPNCIAPYVDYLLEQSCVGETYVESLVLECGSNYYTGKLCNYYYSELLNFDTSILDSFFSESCLSALLVPDTCTYDFECTNALIKVKNLFGCCINNLFNNTYFRSYPSVTTYALNYEVWSQCGVESPGFCPVNYNLERFLSPEMQDGSGSYELDTAVQDLPSIPGGDGGAPTSPPGQIGMPPSNTPNGNAPVVQPPANTNDGNLGDTNIPSFLTQLFPQLQQCLEKNGFKLPEVKEPGISKPDLGNNVLPKEVFPQHKRKTKLQQWGTNDYNFQAKEMKIPTTPADPRRTLMGELQGKKVAKNQKNEKEKRKLNEKFLDLLIRSLQEK